MIPYDFSVLCDGAILVGMTRCIYCYLNTEAPTCADQSTLIMHCMQMGSIVRYKRLVMMLMGREMIVVGFVASISRRSIDQFNIDLNSGWEMKALQTLLIVDLEAQEGS